MKVLSYNISWSKQFKIDWLFTNKGIDAFVVPECANKDNIVVPTWDETNRMSDHVPIMLEVK